MRISDWSSDVCSSDLMPPDYAADVYDAARNLYIARMTQAGRTAWDDNAWRTAISTALGGYRHNGVLYGGFASFKGNPVSLPPGWTSDGLFRRLARARGKAWAKATDRRSDKRREG